MAIVEVQPGSADDPFRAGTSAAGSDGASQGVPAGTVVEGQQVDPSGQTAADASATAAKVTAAAVATGEGGDDSEDLTPEEQEAVDTLFQYRLETEVLPKIQSSVDRRIAALDAAHKRDVAAAQELAQSLRNELREVKLNGLSAEDQAKLKATWEAEDRTAKIDAYEQQVEAMYRDVVVNAYVTEYPHLQLTAEDFEGMDTPDKMETFIAFADREYYKELAARGGKPAGDGGAAPAAAPTREAPAGATAPSDGSASHAAPETVKFDKGSGRQAMVNNIADGWETVQIAQ
jgi:hypothetical protein